MYLKYLSAQKLGLSKYLSAKVGMETRRRHCPGCSPHGRCHLRAFCIRLYPVLHSAAPMADVALAVAALSLSVIEKSEHSAWRLCFDLAERTSPSPGRAAVFGEGGCIVRLFTSGSLRQDSAHLSGATRQVLSLGCFFLALFNQFEMRLRPRVLF